MGDKSLKMSLEWNYTKSAKPVHLDFFLKRLLIFDGFLLFSPLWQRSCGMLLILATLGASCTGLLSLPAEEHDVWRGLGTGMPLESWFMLHDFSRMPLYTLLAGLKIMLFVSVRPRQSGEPREMSAVKGESPRDESSRESSSRDIFRGDNVWYISRLEGGDCFLPMEEFKESHSEAVSGTSLDEREAKVKFCQYVLKVPADVPRNPNQNSFHSLSYHSVHNATKLENCYSK